MRLIGHHDHIAAVGQQREAFLAALGREFLDGGENHTTRCARQKSPQVLAAVGLFRILAEQVLAQAEGRRQLVVQIVAVGQNDNGRVFEVR